MTRRAAFLRSGGVAWCVLFLTGVAVAQGTRADYERAKQLRALTENKVFKAKVAPHWFANDSRFWYRNDLPDKQCEFIVVDAVQGKRGPAFEHGRVAAALSKVLGQAVEPTRLPLERLTFLESESAVVLQGAGKAWKLDLKSYELTPHTGAALPAVPAAKRTRPRPSRQTGAETALTFINRSKGEVRIFWIDAEGQRQAYGSVRSGEEYRQHTFAGHVWLVTDAQGQQLGVFEAVADPGTAVIEDTPAEATAPAPPRRTRDGESPDGKWAAFFKDYNLHLRDLDNGEEFSLSSDGNADDEYSGRAFWAPDSKRLVALRTKKGDDRKVYYVESSPKDQLQPKLHSYSYLKPGDRVPVSKPQLFEVESRKHIALNDQLFSNPWSITDLQWERDASRFTFLYNQRGHQVLRLVGVEATTGEARAVIDEVSPTFIDYEHKRFLQQLPETREAIWMSERDGWNHLYLYDTATGQVKNQITKGPWVVRGVERVDTERRQIWFRAGGIYPSQDPYYVHYARVNFDGTGVVLLTAGDGTHSIEFSGDRRFLIDSWSRVDLPPVTELRRAEDGQLICELERADWSALLKTGWQVPERFVAKGRDGATDIYGLILRPTNFDPQKKYPVIEEIYAGPQSAYVPKGFRSFHAPQAMAELGFILVKIDGLGTSYRSKKFHDVCWKNLGDAGFPDRILWMQAAAAKYPYLDLTRVGVYGGSAGGQNSTGAVLTHGEFYKVAVSDCGCHDNRMDKVWWNELWMGWPVGPHYEAQSNVTLAHRLQGKLLLVVGEMDENVDPASTMQVVNALVKADKDFELLVLPGRGHGSAESPYGSRRRQDFLVRHLLGVEPRSQP